MRPSEAFRHHTTKVRLREQLLTALPSKQGVGLDGTHPSIIDEWSSTRIDEVISTVSARMRDGSYRFTNYREGLASRGRGRTPRIFAIPTIRDRLVLEALKATLADIYGFSGPEPPQRSKAARVIDSVRSGEYTHFLKVDVQDYFASIRQHVLVSQLSRRVRTPAIHALTERALRNSIVAFGQKSRGLTADPDGLPLGLSISSLLAELYLNDFDELFPSARRKFFRYVDDILILTKDYDNPFAAVQSELRRLGLSTHPIDTPGKCEFGAVADGFDYLGYTISDAAVVVTSGGIRRIESQLASLVSHAARISRGPHSSRELGRLFWRLDLLIGGCVIDGEARGWIRYYNRMDNLSVLGHLDALVGDLFKRYGLAAPANVKSFRSAYWASRENSRFRRYAFDLDKTSPQEARTHLIDHESWTKRAVEALTDAQAQSTFRRLVRRHVIDLERDLEPAS